MVVSDNADSCERISIMAENKTKPTRSSVTAFLNKVRDRQLRDGCFAILQMMQEVSHCEPVMWGSAIIGFGTYHYLLIERGCNSLTI